MILSGSFHNSTYRILCWSLELLLLSASLGKAVVIGRCMHWGLACFNAEIKPSFKSRQSNQCLDYSTTTLAACSLPTKGKLLALSAAQAKPHLTHSPMQQPACSQTRKKKETLHSAKEREKLILV